MPRRLLILLAIALGAAAEPRPINEAERAAVGIVARFLARGPVALHAALTPDAPLRALPYGQAVAEIAARTGPVKGSVWKLQTADSATDVAFRVTFASGYDDALLLRMRETGRGWLLHELRTIAEPSAPPPTRPTPAAPPMIAALALLALVALAAAFKRVRFGAVAAAASLGLLAVSIASHFIPQPAPFIELRDAAPLREALARGDDARVPTRLSNDARAISLLWILHSGREAMVDGTKSDPFAGLGLMSATPLGQLVRARVAGDQAAFRGAVDIAPHRDDLLSEAASATSDERYLQRMLDLGSRDAETYYAAARREVAAGRMPRAMKAFRTAWALQPRTREELVRDPRLFPLLQHDAIRELVSFFDAAEPLRAARHAGSQPLPLPPNAVPYVLGDLLRVRIGEATLDVPAGSALAPRSARVVPATHWQRERHADDLRDAEWLLAHPTATSPLRLVRATDALARRKRWSDVLTLTNGNLTAAPPLTVARVDALVRLGRTDEARQLANGSGLWRRDPVAVLAVADAMARSGDHRLAESLYAAVQGAPWRQLADARRRRMAMRRTLAATGLITRTAHFDVRASSDATRIAESLEADLAALRQRLPAIAFRRVTVNLLDAGQLRAATGSAHILGQYDGEILLPLGGDGATRSHELTHALVAQLTRDNAPRWFQEGLAERLSSQAPPKPRRLLPIMLLDALLENAPDQQLVHDGYALAHAFIRFLETRYGAGVTGVLIREFAAGSTTEEALAGATGKSVAALDSELRSVHELAPVADVVRQDVLPQAVR